MTVKNYVLDINKTSLQHPSIVLRQDDYNIYTVNISVTDNGTPVDLGAYTLNFLGITPAGAKIIDSKNFITNAGDLKNGKFSYRFPKEAAGSKGVYNVAYFRLKTTSGATSTIDLNLRVLGGVDLTADEVKDYITVDDTLRNTLVSEVFKKVDAKVDEHLATVKKGEKGEKGDPGKDGYMPIIGGRNLLLDTGRSFTGIGTNYVNRNFNAQEGQYYLAGDKKLSDIYNQYGSSDYLTLSFDWVASDSNISGQFFPQWNALPWDYGIAYGITPSSTNVSGHYTKTFSLANSGYSTSNANGIMFRQDNLQGNITILNVKLEAGNIATDWTPAPEDIDTAIGTRVKKTNKLPAEASDFNYLATHMQTYQGFWWSATEPILNAPIDDWAWSSIEIIAGNGENSGIIITTQLSTNNVYMTNVDNGVIKWWKLIANDTSIVHKTGNETVSGDKTFTGNTTLAATTISAGNYGLRVTSSGFQKTTDGKTWVSANI